MPTADRAGTSLREDDTAGTVNVVYAGGDRDTTARRIEAYADGPVGSGGWFTDDIRARHLARRPQRANPG
jgi:hypothetical protein